MTESRRESGTSLIRKKVASMPMPDRSWERRLLSYALRHPQQQQGRFASSLAVIERVFDRHRFLGPALAVGILGMVYFIQPIHLYNAVVAEQEEAILYLEEITDIAAYEIDFDAWTSSWILEY